MEYINEECDKVLTDAQGVFSTKADMVDPGVFQRTFTKWTATGTSRMAVISEYKLRRDALVEGLNGLPDVSCRLPQGAFYVFPNVSAFCRSSDWLAEYLLNEAGVALLPGTSFGKFGEGYLRLCFANSMENIHIALEKLASAFAKLKRNSP